VLDAPDLVDPRPAPPTLGGAGPADEVVLLDELGHPCGTAGRTTVHTSETPFHLAFSCHAVDRDGRVLLTRRALDKRTWPGVWSNACCGHPRMGETLREAVTRRLEEELGATVRALDLALPDFAYRAEMADGTVEHELCPVLVAVVDTDLDPDPAEVASIAWVGWDDLRTRAADAPGSLSPWSVLQIDALAPLATSPGEWLGDRRGRSAPGLDRRLTLPGAGPQPEAAAPAGGGAPVPTAPGVDAVEDHIRRFIDARAAELAVHDDRIVEVVRAIADLVQAGGKRVRPELLMWGHAAAGGEVEPPPGDVVAAAAAIELLHTFALVHDDVMDRSARRRGRPAAHVTFSDLAVDAASDDPGWFGVSAALLAGDLASAWADEVFSPIVEARARRQFDVLRNEVMAGQYLDVRLALDDAPAEALVRKVALLKSARYTVTRPLLIGAALAGAPAGVMAALERYGDSAGLAFQMRDDVLGLFGDPTTSGKSCLDDLREGKQTLLVTRALRLADSAQRAVLQGALGDPDLDEAGAGAARDVVAATGARASVEALIADECARAVAITGDLPDPAGAALRAMATRLSHRDA
jgi:isopentenyl-diphosphate delta-isomerase type 1